MFFLLSSLLRWHHMRKVSRSRLETISTETRLTSGSRDVTRQLLVAPQLSRPSPPWTPWSKQRRWAEDPCDDSFHNEDDGATLHANDGNLLLLIWRFTTRIPGHCGAGVSPLALTSLRRKWAAWTQLLILAWAKMAKSYILACPVNS